MQRISLKNVTNSNILGTGQAAKTVDKEGAIKYLVVGEIEFHEAEGKRMSLKRQYGAKRPEKNYKLRTTAVIASRF